MTWKEGPLIHLNVQRVLWSTWYYTQLIFDWRKVEVDTFADFARQPIHCLVFIPLTAAWPTHLVDIERFYKCPTADMIELSADLIQRSSWIEHISMSYLLFGRALDILKCYGGLCKFKIMKNYQCIKSYHAIAIYHGGHTFFYI